jgi:hypothetical protein
VLTTIPYFEVGERVITLKRDLRSRLLDPTRT